MRQVREVASHGIRLSKKIYPKTLEERKRMNEISYALAVGSIMYAMLCTRLDVAYALDIASRFRLIQGRIIEKQMIAS